MTRTCVVCRRTNHKTKLLRFVKNEKGQLLFDKKNKLPGRGAYLHMNCINKNSCKKLLSSLKSLGNGENFDIEKLIGVKVFSKKAKHIKPNFR